MKALSTNDQQLFSRINELVNCNPFEPERLRCEKKILGSQFEGSEDSWHISMNPFGQRPNVTRILELSEELLEKSKMALQTSSFKKADIDAYHNLAYWVIYHQVNHKLEHLITCKKPQEFDALCTECFKDIRKNFHDYIESLNLKKYRKDDIAQVFSCFFQIRRAFHYIFTYITGASNTSAKLRATIWQSIFSHDILRYQRGLHNFMRDIPTLICGPSGSGKELVARAIGLSGYIPFDSQQMKFKFNFDDLLLSVNLSAISPQLIESELFGHKKGAFTGALQDRPGWFTKCNESSCLFLDEIGELQPDIQVKLLRVLQARTYQEVGSTTTRHFKGRIIAATNRNLSEEMARGNFRPDFYYRLCANVIETPSLLTIIRDDPKDLKNMVAFIVSKFVNEVETASLRDEVLDVLQGKRLVEHDWPGNFRELEQCVKNVLVRKNYTPPEKATGSQTKLESALENVTMSADELLRLYFNKAYQKYGTYEDAAKVLKVDRRTVKSRLQEDS